MLSNFRSICRYPQVQAYFSVCFQDAVTKTWDQRLADVVENYERHGICQKIAGSTDEDFEKCGLIALRYRYQLKVFLQGASCPQ